MSVIIIMGRTSSGVYIYTLLIKKKEPLEEQHKHKKITLPRATVN